MKTMRQLCECVAQLEQGNGGTVRTFGMPRVRAQYRGRGEQGVDIARKLSANKRCIVCSREVKRAVIEQQWK